jgi:hypothetical protein
MGVSFADFTQFLLFSETYQVTLATSVCTDGQCGPTGSEAGSEGEKKWSTWSSERKSEKIKQEELR